MLLASQIPDSTNPESEAFHATVENFKISLTEIARISGVDIRKIRDFKAGKENLTSRTMSQILIALTPTELSFYSAMVNLQLAAKSANKKIDLLKYREIVDVTDIYRQAFDIVIETFSLIQSDICKKTGIKTPNMSAWKSGSRDLQQETLNKIKNTFTFEQKIFYQSLVEVLLIVASEKMQKVKPRAA